MSEGKKGNQYAAHQQGLSAMFKRAARRIQTEEEVMSVLGLDKEFKAVDVRKKNPRQSYEIVVALST